MALCRVKAWREELRRKVGDPAVEAEVYKMLRIVLEQTNESLFQDCLSALLESLAHGFKKDWVHKKEQWAYCYRVGFGFNTNMFVEAFHSVFKRLGRKVNKRVDGCLVNLMRFMRDKCFGCVIKFTKGKATYRSKNIVDCHL